MPKRWPPTVPPPEEDEADAVAELEVEDELDVSGTELVAEVELLVLSADAEVLEGEEVVEEDVDSTEALVSGGALDSAEALVSGEALAASAEEELAGTAEVTELSLLREVAGAALLAVSTDSEVEAGAAPWFFEPPSFFELPSLLELPSFFELPSLFELPSFFEPFPATPFA